MYHIAFLSAANLHFLTGVFCILSLALTHYVCSNYKSNTGTCSAHFIREETLKLFVLQRIFAVTAMFFDDIQSFQNAVYQQRFAEAEKAVKRQKRELEQARKRIAGLDRIFKRIYEDDINGTISHERFLKPSAEYEAEQQALTEFVKAEQAAVDTSRKVLRRSL